MCECVFTHTHVLQRNELVGERKGVGGGCHGDSNTPVALPTCLPGPNLLREGGEEGVKGGGGRGCRDGGRGRGSE